MSGSGGGGGSWPAGGGGGVAGGGGGGGEGGPIPCESLAFETQLSSPKADVVAGLNPGDVLELALKQEGSIQTIQVLRSGRLAGGLTAPDVKRLRECMLNGHTYTATVISMTGGQVKLRIKIAS